MRGVLLLLPTIISPRVVALLTLELELEKSMQQSPVVMGDLGDACERSPLHLQ
jgi:hypothetical protein